MGGEKFCEHCERSIEKPRANQKFCRGAACRNAAWREQHPRRRRVARKPRWSFAARVVFESIWI
jgi:hypothetical protein